MKINSDYNKSNLFLTNNDNNIGANKPQKNSRYVSDRSPVKVDISAEGIEQYKNTIKTHTPKDEEVKECHILTNHNLELSARINAINDGKENPSVKDKANSVLEAYASLYTDIVEGYNDGTRNVFAEEDDRALTKEEDLAKLEEAFKNHAKSFEELYNIEEESQKRLEESIKGTVWGDKSSKAKTYLQELEKKRESPEYVPSNISEHILNAGDSFLSKISSLKSINHQSIMDLISSIKVW